MKIVFIDKIYSGKNIAEKNFGCSYMVYPIPDISTRYLASIAKDAGFDIEIFQYRNMQNFKKSLPEADIYVFHSVYLSEESDLQTSQHIIKGNIFFYGPSPTLHPEKYLLNSRYYVLRGEIENIFAQALIDPKNSHGVSFLIRGKIVSNKSAGIINDLDTIAFPYNKETAIFLNPKLGNKKCAMILASRGCANRCSFCVPNSISWARELEWKKVKPGKPPVTFRSAQNVLKEIEEYCNAGIKNFAFIDDQFILGQKRTLELCMGLKKLKINYGILARCDKLTDMKIVKALGDSGCKYIDLGVESFNQEILDDIRKNLLSDDIFLSIHNISRCGIEPKVNIMFGTSKLENKKIISETIKQTLALPLKYCMYSIATPFEGTDFHKTALSNGWIVADKKIDPSRSALINYPWLTSRDLERLNSKAYRVFYFRPKIIFYHIAANLGSIKKLSVLVRSSLRFFLRR